MSDVNEIKAGKYVLVALQWDQILSKPGQPFDFKRHRRGDVLDLNVEDARRLVLAGAVVKQGEDPTDAVIPGRQESTAPTGSVPSPKAAVTADPATGDPGTNEPKAPTVKEILADVGEDKEKAAAALEAEKARGDEARSSLVEKLEKVLAAEPASS